FTFLPQNEVNDLIEQHQQDESQRTLQKRLAKELTIFVHGVDEYLKAVETTTKLFSQRTASANDLTEEDLKGMEGIVHIDFSKEKLQNGMDAVSFLAETTIFPSKGEARKMIQNGGVSINRTKINTVDEIINDKHLLHEKYLLIQKGKKNYYLVNAL
ncbi:MAG: tyrosine--tRNA ligase, partial [Flavisolibacter sp.]